MNKLKINAEIISPICLWNGKEWDWLDFFIDEDNGTFCLVDQNWIERAIEENMVNSKQLLNAIREWDFQELAVIKEDLWKDFFDIKAEYQIGDDAFKTLWQYWNSSNQWFVKQQFANILDNEVNIPWSTIKWIMRTAYLYSLISWEITLENIRLNRDERWKIGRNPVSINNIEEVKNIEDMDKMNGELNDKLFKRIACADAKINDGEIVIQTFQSKNKPLKDWAAKKWISLVVQSVAKWNMEFEITETPNNLDIDLSDFEPLIKSYSEMLIDREERLTNSVNFWHDFIETLRNYYAEWKYPIKLWMYKKSLTYKLWWDELADALNQQKKWKDWKEWAMKLWIWDKTIYVDEDENPVGWIVLSFAK